MTKIKRGRASAPVSATITRMNPWYVLTGAPSSGKSTLLSELAARGHRTVPEAARFVIEREIAAGRSIEDIRGNAADFQHTVLDLKLEWERSLPHDEIIFFDRGIPDTKAYYLHEGIPNDEALRKALVQRNYRKIFILSLISEENFVRDGARSENWQGAVALDRLLEDVYRDEGYEVIRADPMPLQERVDFILERL